ncbi:hypothetical protein FJZ53_05355 [Candidatus Woesearchaeota archaeon]|nr:hypothetical protein [Candidatus Woesearchaeota archaeon]
MTFFVLSFFLLILYLTIVSTVKHKGAFLIALLGLCVLIIGLIQETKKLKHERYTLARELEVLIAIPLSTVVTFFLSTKIDMGYGFLGPVIAAGIVGLLGSYLKTYDLANPIYCGAFVGMSSAQVAFSSFWFMGIAGLTAGLIFILSHEVYNQTGGTLGAIAFSSVTIARKIIMMLGGLV